jgi:hypothetical protein
MTVRKTWQTAAKAKRSPILRTRKEPNPSHLHRYPIPSPSRETAGHGLLPDLLPEPADIHGEGVGIDECSSLSQRSSMSFSRVTTAPPALTRMSMSLNSVPVSWRGSPSRNTRCIRNYELEGAGPEGPLRASAPRSTPAKNGIDPGEEFIDAERLGDIVIAPDIEPHHHVHLLVTGGEKDDGEIGDPADVPAQVESASVGKPNVEDRQIEAGRDGYRSSLGRQSIQGSRRGGKGGRCLDGKSPPS